MNTINANEVKAGTTHVVGYVREDGKFVFTTEHRSEKAANKILGWNRRYSAIKNYEVRKVI